VSDGDGIPSLALRAAFAANILLSLRLVAGTDRAPSIRLLPLVALEDIEPRARARASQALDSGEGSVRWVPEDALPTITRPPPRSEMVKVFLQRAALKDGPPGRGPVSLADSVLLTQGEPPDADLKGVCVGRLTHAHASEGAGFSLSHALYVFLCVVAVAIAVAKGGREEAPPLPRPEPLDGDAQLAGRLRDPVGGWPVLSHVPKIRGAPQRVYRNWLGKPIPVLGPRALTADNPTWPSRCRTLWQVSVHVAPPGMGQVSAPGSMPPSGV
jgi:hypothetical protein